MNTFTRQVTHPLCDRNLISARLDAVSEIVACMGSPSSSQASDELDEESSERKIVPPELYHVLSSVLTALSRSPDIQRGITRIFHRTAKATEVKLGLSFTLFICVCHIVQYCHNRFLQRKYKAHHLC